MRMPMRAFAFIAGLVLLASCAGWGPHEPHEYFVLQAPREATPHSPVTGVRVARTTAAAFYDTQDIVFSRSEGTRAYYRYHHWTERPQRAFHAQLLERFAPGPGITPLELETNVDEIYHDAVQSPGAARIAVTAQLLDASTHEVVARRTFRASVPLASYDAPGAVAGLREALGSVLHDIAAWVAAQPPR